jgi:hypothetical protein
MMPLSYPNVKAKRWLPYVILAVVTGLAAPGEKPSFTGVWKLIAIERDGMTLSAGEQNTFDEIQVWSHDEPKLTIRMTSRDQTESFVTQLSYTLDGKSGQCRIPYSGRQK